MTIFHVIKYSDVNIYNNEELGKLPDTVLNKWKEKLKDFSISLTESLSSVDTYCEVMPGILDALNHYGKDYIDDLQLQEAIHQFTKGTLRNSDRDENDIETIMAYCAWHIYYGIAKYEEESGAMHIKCALELAGTVDDHYLTVDSHKILTTELSKLLLEYDQ